MDKKRKRKKGVDDKRLHKFFRNVDIKHMSMREVCKDFCAKCGWKATLQREETCTNGVVSKHQTHKFANLRDSPNKTCSLSRFVSFMKKHYPDVEEKVQKKLRLHECFQKVDPENHASTRKMYEDFCEQCGWKATLRRKTSSDGVVSKHYSYVFEEINDLSKKKCALSTFASFMNTHYPKLAKKKNSNKSHNEGSEGRGDPVGLEVEDNFPEGFPNAMNGDDSSTSPSISSQSSQEKVSNEIRNEGTSDIVRREEDEGAPPLEGFPNAMNSEDSSTSSSSSSSSSSKSGEQEKDSNEETESLSSPPAGARFNAIDGYSQENDEVILHALYQDDENNTHIVKTPLKSLFRVQPTACTEYLEKNMQPELRRVCIKKNMPQLWKLKELQRQRAI